jgi:hypothetical protein
MAQSSQLQEIIKRRKEKEAEKAKLETSNPNVDSVQPPAAEPVKDVKTNEVNTTEAPDKKNKAVKKEKVSKVILKNVFGKEVDIDDYFYKGVVPPGFEGTCGNPVDREELVEVFNKVFRPEDNILFYKQSDKEVYIVIVPIKNSTDIGEFNNSLEGAFQKHAISFLNEGSVNPDTLRIKLERINSFVKYTNR